MIKRVVYVAYRRDSDCIRQMLEVLEKVMSMPEKDKIDDYLSAVALVVRKE